MITISVLSDYSLSTPWLHFDYSLTTPWLLTDCPLTTLWLLSTCSLTTPWLLPDYSLTTLWLLSNCSLTTPWPLSDYFVLTLCLLSDCITRHIVLFTAQRHCSAVLQPLPALLPDLAELWATGELGGQGATEGPRVWECEVQRLKLGERKAWPWSLTGSSSLARGSQSYRWRKVMRAPPSHLRGNFVLVLEMGIWERFLSVFNLSWCFIYFNISSFWNVLNNKTRTKELRNKLE